MQTKSEGNGNQGGNSNPRAILAAQGFQIRGNRATCPFCEGRRGLTVAVHGELFYCHRCQRGGSVRQIAGKQGVTLPPPRVRKADKPKADFRLWLSAKMTRAANLERRLYQRAEWAKACLHLHPDHEGAWAALARWYHTQRRFQIFWQSASDRVGRYWLYRAWRAHAAR